MTFLIAEPVRNLGRFTFADVISFRFDQTGSVANLREDETRESGALKAYAARA